MRPDAFTPHFREPQSYIEEATERAFRGGFWVGLVAGAVLTGLLAVLLFVSL